MSDYRPIIDRYLCRWPEGRYLENEMMSAHTSFRIGGPAAVMFMPSCAEEAAFILSLLREDRCRTLVMGNGTNLLCADTPLDIAVVRMGENLSDIRIDGHTVTAGAGALLSRVASAARDASLTGFEFAYGIPGSIGGGVFMNAGAYDGQMQDVVRSVTAVTNDGSIKVYSGSECDFAYRHSRFADSGEVVLSASLELMPKDRKKIKEKMDDLMSRRREKQPIELPSAGSTFKRPVNGYAAALIEQAGLKGYRVGGAAVSEKHAGFVVNVGGAAFEDVIAVMEHVRETVKKSAGIELEPEVVIVR